MRFTIGTQGHGDVIDITGQIATYLDKHQISTGLVLIFVPGSTAAVTTMEFENGLINDLIKTLNRLAPEAADYEHHQRWGDHNGAAHIKAAIIGPSLTVPIKNGRLQLGDWQQIVLIDFDELARHREIIVQFVSE